MNIIFKTICLVSFFFFISCRKTSYYGLNNKDFAYKSSVIKAYSIKVDTRNKIDFKNGHLANAINIPFSDNFLSDLENYLESKNAPKGIILFIYAATKVSTNNQVNEIKQRLKRGKNRKIYAVNYLSEDYK